MKYRIETQRMINKVATAMVCFVLALFVTIIMRGWVILDIICMGLIGFLFVLFQFTNLDKRIICIITSIVGVFSFFSLSGLAIAMISMLMIIYNVILFQKLSKNK
ncbi:MAG: hypothetical protein GX758_01615 [Tenericutes bacterium]|nr:hypothetical protein [Mycoplasmatota bacterium]